MKIDEKAFEAAFNATPVSQVTSKRAARWFLEKYEVAKLSHQPDERAKTFTLESALDYLRAHNDGVYKITASKNCDALVAWLLEYLQSPKQESQPDELSPEFFNSHADHRLTKSGGIGFDLWCYILELETKAHDFPTGKARVGGWRDYYENDYTPHLSIEEDFNYAG